MKLGLRLKQIETMVAPDYEHIWDCCCDHGYLGASLIKKQRAPNIHLVDVVPELINDLNEKLSQHIPANPDFSWDTHCLDISHLPLNEYSGKQLVIIAGVGGDLMAQLVNDITLAHPHIEFDFLLCPVHHLYTLRQQLIELNMMLKEEVLVKENKRIYEILLLSSPPAKIKNSHNEGKENPLSPIGSAIWQAKAIEKQQRLTELQVAKEYLTKTINHYQRMQYGNKDPEIKNILQAYLNVRINSQ